MLDLSDGLAVNGTALVDGLACGLPHTFHFYTEALAAQAAGTAASPRCVTQHSPGGTRWAENPLGGLSLATGSP